MIQKVAKKRENLLKPILDKVDAAVKSVGKENGYAMIFDTSLFNFVLSVDDTQDVMPLIKKEIRNLTSERHAR